MHTERPGHATSSPRAPELHGDAPRRVTAQSVAAAESNGLGFSPRTLAREGASQRRPQEENGTRGCRRRQCQSTELSLDDSPATQRGPRTNVTRQDLYLQIWTPPPAAPEPPTVAPNAAHTTKRRNHHSCQGARRRATMQPATRSRHPGVHAPVRRRQPLAPTARRSRMGPKGHRQI